MKSLLKVLGLILKPFGLILGAPARILFLHRIKKPRPLVWLAKTIAFLFNTIIWVIVLVLAGALGPIISTLATPVASLVGVDAKIEKCVILPLGGYVQIAGVRVENPKTFREKDAEIYGEEPLAVLKNFEIDVAVLHLLKKEVRVDLLQLEGVRALYAFDYDTTNVDALIEGITGKKDAVVEDATEEVVEASEETPEEAPTEVAETQPTEQGEPWNVYLKKISISDNSVTIRKRIFGKSVPFPVVLPPVAYADIDGKEFVSKMQNTFEPVVKSIKAITDGLAKGGEMLSDGAGAVLDGAGALAGDAGEAGAVLLDGAGDAGAAVLEGAGAAGEKAVEELKNLGEGLKKLW